MAKAVIMPKFGFTQESAQIVRWLKRAGETVEQGEPIAEVTTDKVNMEVEAPASGILDGLRYAEGDTVPVTEVIAYIRSAGEAPIAETADHEPQTTETADRRPQAAATPVAEKMARDKGIDLSTLTGTGPGGRVTRRDVEAAAAADGGKTRAAPAARRLARELGVDLSAIAGSGPRGRIQSADVRAAHAQAAQAAEPTAVSGLPSALGGSILRTIPLTGMRRTIATRLQQSFQQSPHIFFDAHIDATALEALRAQANERLPKDAPRVSVTAIIAKACAWALGRHPMLNSRIEGENIVLLGDIHLGIAVALNEGLIVPVVRNAPRKGLAQLAAEIADLAERARSNRLRPDDVAGGTFTISNLGMFGVDRFTAVINPPQVGILAVGATRKQIMPDENDRPVARPILTVTLSADHRVVDGAVAARFLKDLRDGLEQPALLTL